MINVKKKSKIVTKFWLKTEVLAEYPQVTANLGGSNFLFDCIRGNRSANGLILSVCGQEINFEARVHIYAPLTDVNLSFLPLKVNVLSSLLSYPDISI